MLSRHALFTFHFPQSCQSAGKFRPKVYVTVPHERFTLSLLEKRSMGTIVEICNSRGYCRILSNMGVGIDKFNQCRQRCHFFGIFPAFREQISIQFPDITRIV